MEKPYRVGNGLYCDEVGAYETFEEALEHYKRLPKPGRTEWRAIGIWNQDQVDVDDSTGLTEEEQEAVDEADSERS